MRKGRYAAVVDVPFFLSALASPALLKSKLEEKGFQNVAVSREKPPGFPLGSEGDYYVSVSWNRDPQVFDVPEAVVERKKVT